MAITQAQLNMILGMNPPPPNSMRSNIQNKLSNTFQGAKDLALETYEGGAPYRNAIGSAFRGDFTPVMSGLRNARNEVLELSTMKLPTNSNL